MSTTPVDVVMDVAPDGTVTVTVAGVAWDPQHVSEPGAGIRLVRTDVPSILDQLLTEHNSPLRVVLHDDGHVFTDIVTRDRLAHLTPRPEPGPEAPAPPTVNDPPDPPDSPRRAPTGWFEADGYTPGEQIAVAVIVTRLRADARGGLGFTLPAALRAMAGDLIAVGEESRQVTVHQSGHEPAALGAIRNAPGAPASPGTTRDRGAGADGLDHGLRRHADSPAFPGGPR